MRLSKIILAIWIFFWAFFLVRGFYKGEFQKSRALLIRAPEARRAYVVGEDLYDFLQFSLKVISKESTYQIKGTLEPIDRARLIYYLYPGMESDNPEYILCYKVDENFSQEGFYKLAALKNNQFILKRKKAD